MCEGDAWRIHVPAELAYGAKGAGPPLNVPPHSAVIFSVELFEVFLCAFNLLCGGMTWWADVPLASTHDVPVFCHRLQLLQSKIFCFLCRLVGLANLNQKT